MRQVQVALALLVLGLALPIAAQKAVTCATGQTCDLSGGLTANLTMTGFTQDVQLVVASPTAAGVNMPFKISRALTASGTASCFARGGNYSVTNLVLRLQECTAPGTCADITGDVTITANDTAVTGIAYTDSAWAAGSWLQIDVTTDSTTVPTVVSCLVTGVTS